MQLVWLVEEAKRRGAAGVPGWPASDHDEPNTKTAREKVASGLYAPKPAEKKAAKEVADGNGS